MNFMLIADQVFCILGQLQIILVMNLLKNFWTVCIFPDSYNGSGWKGKILY